MKPAIVFVAAFVVSAAGSTGAKVMLTKPKHAAADSTKIGVDSTGTDSSAKLHEAASDIVVVTSSIAQAKLR